jgi:hypothetical protein
MSKRSLTPLVSSLALGCLALPVHSATASPCQERYLKDTDLRKFAGSLQDYLEARDESKGVTDAEADLKDQVDKLQKKLSKTPAQGNLLASPGDLGYGIWLSYDYDSKKRKAKAGKVNEQEFWDDYLFTKADPLPYAVWTPEKYRPKTDSYTLVISIPDLDVKPFDHITERWTDQDMRSATIVVSPQMPEDTTLWEENDGIARVMGVYKELTNNWAVNFDRIYISGRGRGVQTAVHIASIWPDRFAGVIGRTGEVGTTQPDNFGNLPTYFAGGGAKVSSFADAAKAAGFDNVSLQADGKEKDIWEWIQAHPRISYPEEITLVATRLTNRMYWLQVPRTDGTTLVAVKATVDRDTNTITVEGVGVNEFTLHFCDAVVDLNKEVTVIANGQVYKDKIQRSFRETVQNIYNAAIDPGKILVASKFYHLPASQEDSEGDN